MATGLAPEVVAALAPLLERPETTAVITDFDGTLAPIVVDPAGAEPVEGAIEAMASLTRRFRVVAVVSGRPASFLVDRVTAAGRSAGGGGPAVGLTGPGLAGLRLVGLYGLEEASGDGVVTTVPEAEQWRVAVHQATTRLRAVAPDGVEVEDKGLAVTVHWRRAHGEAGWVESAVGSEASRTGLVSHRGRMSLELRPPTGTDKGSVVRALVAGCTAACYLGDDLGDLPAFHTLAGLASTGGLATVSVAAVDAESPAEVAEAADVVVPGPDGALEVLRWLAGAEQGPRPS